MATPHRLTSSLVALAITALIASACSSSGTGDATLDALTDSTTSTTDASEVETTDESVGQTLGTPRPPVEPVPLTNVFTKLTEPGVGGRITSITFDPSNPDRLFVGGDMLGIAVTNDFGDTWESTTGLASWEIGDITTTPSADGRIWTGSLSGPQASTDGIAWELSRNGMPALSDSTYTLATESVLVDPTNNS